MKNQRGFTLIEMLVAVLIVGISVTVFFQLLSAGMKLSHKSRQQLAYSRQVEELFLQFTDVDIRDDSFPWNGQIDDFVWQMQLFPVQVRQQDIDDDSKAVAASDEDEKISLPSELYRLEFTLFSGDKERQLGTLSTIRRYPLSYFNQQFLHSHLQRNNDHGQ